MQRSSPSIGTLAAALAKAQANWSTRKSRWSPPSARKDLKGPNNVSLRALSSGLDIVRRFLGSTRSPRCRRRPSIRLPASSI